MSEVLDETGVDDDVTLTDDAAAESDAVARAEEPEAVAPSAPSIDWDNLPPEAEARLAGLSQQQALTLLEQLGLVSYEQPQQEGPPAPDPLSDTYQQDLDRYVEAKLAAQSAPFQSYIDAQRAQETNTVIDGALATAAKTAGVEAADAGLLRSVAAHFAAQPEYARYGATMQGVEATAKAAADWLVNERKTAADAAVLNYRKQIGEIQDTPAEPSGTGGGLGIEQKPTTYDGIIAKYSGGV